MIPAKSENRDWGFYGTMSRSGYDPDETWDMAVEVVAAFWPAAHPRIAARRARTFLDSSGGRHLADAVAGHRDIQKALRRALPSFYGWLSSL